MYFEASFVLGLNFCLSFASSAKGARPLKCIWRIFVQPMSGQMRTQNKRKAMYGLFARSFNCRFTVDAQWDGH